VTPELSARLAVYRIQLLSEAKEFSIVARDTCFALLYKADHPAAGISSSGMMTENGMAYLIWREGEPRLVSKGSEIPASAEEVAAIRSFAEDLKAVIERWKEELATDEHR
jgi:hypothetical protein